MAEPVLKWAGGKRQLLDELLARFPSDYGDYHEPFVGGGALFFALEPERGTINDANPKLINFYEQIRDRPEAVVELAESFDDPESDPDPDRAFSDGDRDGSAIDSYYYQQRALFNRRPYGEEFDPVEEAALLLYLNRTGYNGLYRENGDGGFNVPIGRYANPDWVQAERIRAASRVLAGTTIRNDDFEYVLDAAVADDLVYVDPPYEPTSPTANFTDYSAAGFDRGDQERLLETARALDEVGAHVIVSNSGVTYELYDDAGFRVEREGATRAINSDADNRDEVDEIVATNVPESDRRRAGQPGISDFRR